MVAIVGEAVFFKSDGGVALEIPVAPPHGLRDNSRLASLYLVWGSYRVAG